MQQHAPTRDQALASPSAAPTTRPDLRGKILRRLLLLADVLALVSSYWTTTSLATVLGDRVSNLPVSWVVLGAGLPIWLVLAYGHGLYHVDSRRAEHGVAEEIGPTLQVATLWSWSLLLVMWLAQINLPIGELAAFWALSILITTVFRSGVRAWSRRRSWYLQNTLVLGTGREVEGVVDRILRHPEYGLNVVACMEYFDGSNLRYIRHIPVLRADVDVMSMVETYDIDRVIIAWSARARSGPQVEGAPDRFELVRQLSNRDVYVDLLPTWSQVLGSHLEVGEMEGLPLLGVPRTRLSRSALLLKRTFDIAISAAALLFLLPVLTACAVAIKATSRGPVFFRQNRIGRDGKAFRVFKFRSMHTDAEDNKSSLDAMSLHVGTDGKMFKVREDPRVTPVGRMLRRTSLDELPQLINILRGDMSLVGPRPLIENEDRQVEGRFRRRLDLTPGLTGLWQVHGRSEIPFEQMVNLDYLYVSSWSLLNDFKILLKTVPAVLRRRGAY